MDAYIGADEIARAAEHAADDPKIHAQQNATNESAPASAPAKKPHGKFTPGETPETYIHPRSIERKQTAEGNAMTITHWHVVASDDADGLIGEQIVETWDEARRALSHLLLVLTPERITALSFANWLEDKMAITYVGELGIVVNGISVVASECVDERCRYSDPAHPVYVCPYCDGRGMRLIGFDAWTTCFGCQGSGRTTDIPLDERNWS